MWIKVIREKKKDLKLMGSSSLTSSQGPGAREWEINVNITWKYIPKESQQSTRWLHVCLFSQDEYASPLSCSSWEEKIYLPYTPEPSAKWPRLPLHLRLPRGPYIGATQQDHSHSALGTSLEYPCCWLSTVPLPELTDFWKNRRNRVSLSF